VYDLESYTNGKNIDLQALQFHKIRVCREPGGRAGVGHYKANKRFLEGCLVLVLDTSLLKKE